MLLLRAQSLRFECARAVIAVKCMQTMHLFARYRPRTFASLSILGHFFRFFSPAEALNPKDGEDIHTRARAKIRRTRTRDGIIRAKIGRRAVRILGTNQKNAEKMNIETRTCHSSFRAYEIS